MPSDTVLSERPHWVPEWNSLSSDERRLYARMMEVYAGFLTHTDAQVGRDQHARQGGQVGRRQGEGGRRFRGFQEGPEDGARHDGGRGPGREGEGAGN